MCAFGIAPLIVRWFEFATLNILWDANAYGSMLWMLLGLHTAHLLTDVGDTIVLAVLMFTRHGYSGRRFGDVQDNAFYWDFVVVTWLPIYFSDLLGSEVVRCRRFGQEYPGPACLPDPPHGPSLRS